MVLSIHDVEELVSVVLVSGDHSKDVLLNLSIGNATLKWPIFSLKSWTDILGNFGHVNDFATGAITDDTSDERLASEGLTENDRPLSFVAKMLVKGAFVPCAHRLQAVLLLEK